MASSTNEEKKEEKSSQELLDELIDVADAQLGKIVSELSEIKIAVFILAIPTIIGLSLLLFIILGILTLLRSL
jgi:uncharacterized membrane protein YqjE